MRIPERCSCGGRALVYCSVRHYSFLVRYRRCDRCSELSKSIVLNPALSGIPIVGSEQVSAKIIDVPFDSRRQEQGI